MRFLWALAATSMLSWSADPVPRGPSLVALTAARVFVSTDLTRDGSRIIEHFPAVSPAEAGKFTPTGDGGSILVLRFRSAGAPAVRLLIGDMRIPEGSRLFIYGIRAGTVTDVIGPYMGSGGAPEDRFWTDAVRGSEVAVELQIDTETPADLPFQVLAIAWSDLAEVRTAPGEPGTVQTSEYRGRTLTYEVVNGLAVFESDIILGPADQPFTAGKQTSFSRQAISISDGRYLWPGGTVPYFIDSSVPSPARVMNAIAYWNSEAQGHVRLVPRTNEVDYVAFQRASSAGTCSSYVGRRGFGEQLLLVGDNCSTGNMIHEIGHVFGLWHEQSREDRDKFVRILWENIEPSKQHNFSQNISSGDDIGSYDHSSIMHYGAFSFSFNGQPTIETIPKGVPIGQRTRLSVGDIAAVRRLYPAAATPPKTPLTATTTITTNPEGLPITVDGVTYTSPHIFNWQIGSTHTIGTVNTTTGTARNTFQKWSNGGAQTQSISANSKVTLYTADFSVAYKVQATAKWPGTVSVSPASGDQYYLANSKVNLSASAPSGYCFTGWADLLPGTPPTTSLTVTKSYTIQAGFQPGSTTVDVNVEKVHPGGGLVSIGVNSDAGCAWTVATSSDWLTVVSSASGSGTDVATVKAAPNTHIAARTGVVVVSGTAVTVSQPAGSVRSGERPQRSNSRAPGAR